jgi:hypothetical protein
MRNFILDANPKFGEVKITIEHTSYELKRVRNNGAILSVFEHGTERDQLTLTTQDMRALYCLLSVKDEAK